MDEPSFFLDTKLIHTGEPRPRIMGAVALPIFQSATFEYQGGGDYHELRYIRLNNTPNHIALHQKLAALEGGEDAVVAATGMAAISTALFSVLSAGDHLLVQDCLYGGTSNLLEEDFPRLGISHDAIDPRHPEQWKRVLRPNTKAIYVESITNPLMGVMDLGLVAKFAKAHGILSIIDNTFATPVCFRPLELGFDLVIHSATKYLNGHSDIVAGAVVGSNGLIKNVKKKLNHLGGTLDPHACFLLHRGMKTLALRVRHQNASAMQLARHFAAHVSVKTVNFPGLPEDPSHRMASQYFTGFGAMISLELAGGMEAVEPFMTALTLPVVAPSLGGVETLIALPSRTSHSGMSRAAREKAGIAEDLVRISIGIEDPRDLIADFDRALAVTR